MFLACIAVVLGLLAGAFFAFGPQSDPSDQASEAAPGPAFGVFRGTSPTAVAEFSQSSKRDVEYVIDYSARATWQEIARPDYMLEAWKNRGYRMVYATAMLPTEDKTATIAAGAQGDYDEHYTILANNLVAAGQGNAIIRLGWEFNVPESRWHPTSREDFISYWQRIVTAMRAAPGAENLEFDWTVNIGSTASGFDPRVYFPGRDYVDYVGVDVYDTSWAEKTYPFPKNCDESCREERRQAAWANQLDGPLGLTSWVGFAKAAGLPLSVPEWGLWERPDGHGGGDNPYFIEQMLKFIETPENDVAYHAYFDFDVAKAGTHELSAMPQAQQRFQELIAP
ncbi:glycoside hydrolase family 26 protein [Kineosporia babensis]|uniref:GH26 domain-containing protein n=1 Tax=Kineosporia babensis TaxID=499548 RepID=A0A9X1SVU5_9ACTN|nr:hypothetical protein [Kineosporia babensis]MCD5314066.1 hypothetical protein [Kineosporia babensis]